MFSFTFLFLCNQRIIALILFPAQQPRGFPQSPKHNLCVWTEQVLESASANCLLLTAPHFLSSASYLPLLQILGCHKETPSHVEELPCQAVWKMQKMHKFSFFFFSPSLVFKQAWKQHAPFKSSKRRKGFSDGIFLPLVVLQAILQLFPRMKIQKLFTLFRDFIHTGLQSMQNYKQIYYWQGCKITSFSSVQRDPKRHSQNCQPAVKHQICCRGQG